MTYVSVSIDTDENTIAQTSYDLIAARVPGWQPAATSLDTAIIEANARQAAELRALLADVPDDIFAAFGTSILGFAPITDTAATGVATFTFTTAAPTGGYLIPGGTLIGLTAPDGSLTAFATTTDITAPSASTTQTAAVAAVIPGTVGNGYTGAAVMIDSLPFVASVAITTTTSSAVDAETSQAYLDRLVRRMQLVAVHPILAQDFALLAMDQPGVYRALAVDGYDPVGNTTGNLRTVAVFLQGADGQAVSSGVKTAVDTLLQADREVNFVVTVSDPLITTINVVTTVTKAPAAVSADVFASVDAAIVNFLNPATWGGPVVEGDPPWVDKHIVYIDELRSAIYQAAGVTRVTALTINTVTTDITLSGGRPHGIPQPGTRSITVS